MDTTRTGRPCTVRYSAVTSAAASSSSAPSNWNSGSAKSCSSLPVAVKYGPYTSRTRDPRSNGRSRVRVVPGSTVEMTTAVSSLPCVFASAARPRTAWTRAA